jgi:hypothetical protein
MILKLVSGPSRTLIGCTALIIPDTVGVKVGTGVLLGVGGISVRVGVKVKVGKGVLLGAIVAVTREVRLGIGCRVAVAGSSSTIGVSELALQAARTNTMMLRSKDSRFIRQKTYWGHLLVSCFQDIVISLANSCYYQKSDFVSNYCNPECNFR